jgi:hypothetical protein
MMIRKNAFAGVAVSILLLSGVALTGCSDQTKEAASNTVQSADQDAANHVAAADQAVKQSGHDVAVAGHDAAVATKDAAHDAAVATKDAAHDAAKATGDAAKATGQAVTNGVTYADKAVGGTVKGVAKATDATGKALTMTPMVKDALIKSNLDTSTINVDTNGETNTVALKGTVHSAKQKSEATQIAMRTIKGAGEQYSVKNELTVTP